MGANQLNSRTTTDGRGENTFCLDGRDSRNRPIYSEPDTLPSPQATNITISTDGLYRSGINTATIVGVGIGNKLGVGKEV